MILAYGSMDGWYAMAVIGGIAVGIVASWSWRREEEGEID